MAAPAVRGAPEWSSLRTASRRHRQRVVGPPGSAGGAAAARRFPPVVGGGRPRGDVRGAYARRRRPTIMRPVAKIA